MSILRLFLLSALTVTLCSRLAAPWTWTVLLLTFVVNAGHAIFTIWIYPFYLSPLRDLPEPKVAYTARASDKRC